MKNLLDKSMYGIIEKYMFDCMKDAAHDPEHIFRVLYQSINIASERPEIMDYDVLIASCLLHDIGREEQFKNHNLCHAEVGGIKAKDFLINNNWSENKAIHVNKCISSHRFRGNNIPETIEAKILFDSDKLDVTGCLGIARTLLYKGHVKSKIYEINNGDICFGNNKSDDETFLKEYNFKLIKLYDKFYTEEAQRLANKQKEHAQYFYDKLVEQVKESYKSREVLNRIICE
jgi:uncharacterized protein